MTPEQRKRLVAARERKRRERERQRACRICGEQMRDRSVSDVCGFCIAEKRVKA